MSEPMKTPDEIKKDAIALIRQTHASYRQLSKVLCGKENATLDELLQGAEQLKQKKPGEKLICEITVDGEDIRKALEKLELDGKTIVERLEPVKGHEQLEAELAAVKQERDTAVKDLCYLRACCNCKYRGNETNCAGNGCCYDCALDCPCAKSPCAYEWRGVCPENTEVQDK